MSVVTGSAAHTDRAVSKSLGYDTTTEVGTYLFAPVGLPKPFKAVRRIVVRGVPCPYCRGPLSRLDPRDGQIIGRVITIRKEDAHKTHVVVDPIPKTVWAVACLPCRVGFTVPNQRSAHASSCDAVGQRSESPI